MQPNKKAEPICVTASLTPDDIFRAQKVYFSKRKKAHRNRLIAATAFILLPFATYFFVRWYIKIMRPLGWIDLSPSQVRLVTIMLVLGAATVTVFGMAYLIGRRRDSKSFFRKGLEKRASLCTYTFSEDIKIATPIENSVVSYGEITEMLEDYYGLLLVPDRGAVIYLPTRVLYGDELREVKHLVEVHLGENKDEPIT